jgi:tetratricopeptide (TPR) repeat protein
LSSGYAPCAAAQSKDVVDKTAAKPAVKVVTRAAKQTEAAQTAGLDLYQQAVTAYKQDDLAHALELARSACVQAPKNAKLRGGLAVMESTRPPLLNALASAKEAAKLAVGDACIQTNYGILLEKNGQRAEAVERFKKAEALGSKDYRPRVGIAQCLGVDGADGLTIAANELQAAIPLGEDSVDKWMAIGQTYLVLRQNAQASACFTKALKLDGQNYGLKVLRIKSALAEHDVATVKALVPDVLGDKLSDRDVLLGLSLLPDNDFAPELKRRLSGIAERNYFGQGEFFYQLGRNFEVNKHLDMAFDAYQTALRYSPGECQYIVSEIGNRLAAGRDGEAVTIWGQSSAERKKSPPTSSIPLDRSIFAHVFNSIGELLQASDPGIHMVQAKFKNIKCGCRLPVIKTKMVAQPGVVFANLEDAKEKDYPCTLVYDVKKNSADNIFKHVRQADDIIEVIADSPVQSIPELVHLIQIASDKPDKHVFSLWSFTPPPMELPQ